MVKAEFRNKVLHFIGLVFLMLLAFTAFSSPQTSARNLNEWKNRYENERKNLCFNDPANYSIYGVVWVNNQPLGITDDRRWSIDLNVAWDAKVIDATMWTTAANCPDGARRTNARIFDLAAVSGGSVPLSFPYGNSINRGDSNPGTFADPPGSLRVSLNVDGKASPGGGRDCNHTISYRGTYADSRGAGASTVFTNQLCITRQARPQITVEGRIWDRNGGAGIPNVTVRDCENPNNTTRTGSDGFYRFTKSFDSDYCVKADVPTGYQDRLLYPWGSSYRGCPANTLCAPSEQEYHYQKAGVTRNDAQYTNFDRDRDNGFDFTFVKSTPSGGLPIGNISAECTSSNLGKVRTSNFSDPDGPTSAYITSGSSVPYATTTSSPYTWSGIPIPASGSVLVTLYVKNVGNGSEGEFVAVDTATLSNSRCTVPPQDPNCAEPNETVSLPETARPSTSSGYSYTSTAPSGSTTTRNAKVATLAGGAGYRIDSAKDQYSSPTSVTWTGTGRQSTNNFTMNYNNYKTQYPYDSHDTTVGYTEWWAEQQYYSSSSVDFYTCNSGDSLSGSTCTKTTTQTTSPTATCTTSSTGVRTCTYSCPAGYTASGTGASTTCSRQVTSTYSATANYNWHTGNTAERTNTATITTGQGGLTTFPECYQRTFNVHEMTDTPSTSASVTMSPDNEDPTSATFSGTVFVDFGYDAAATSPAGLRNANKVTLNWSANYYVVQAGESTDPSNGDPFTISCGLPNRGTVTVNGRNTASNNESANITIPPCNATFIPPLKAGDRVCVAFAISPKGSRINQQGQITSNNGVTVRTHNCGPILADQPYMHVRGLDVSAGGSFANGMRDQCVGAPQNPGRIIANLKNAGSALARGSASQYGALALGNINGFASASHRDSIPTASSGLTFANNGTNGNLGGQHCIPDFYSAMPPVNNTVTGTYNMSSLNGNRDKEVVRSDGDLRLRMSSGGGSGIKNGNLVAIYVNGDVYIEDNIRFKDTSWVNKSDVPSFFLIVRGNIFISPDVERIDGILVAQGGTINTCAPGFGNYSSDQLYDSCNDRQLTVNGALIANQVRFLRTFASLRNAQGGELPIVPSNPARCATNTRTTSRPAIHDCAAEIINFSPEIYLSEPAMLPIGGPAVGKYDYITSLSPVL